MWNQLRPAFVSFVALTFVTGVLYPAVVTGVVRLLFFEKATGSVIVRDGRAVGSGLIGQSFSAPNYFWPRPSAAGYDAAAGAGSNLGPSNPALAEAASARVKAAGGAGPVPVDLVTASGSGLDPHISPAAAEWQVARVAKARGLEETAVRQAVSACTEGRSFGVLGEPRVNVLRLNLLLDHATPSPHASAVREDVVGWRGRAFSPTSN